MRTTLLTATREALAKSGFFVSAETRVRPLSFDLVARRDDQLLMVKVLTNVDSLSEIVAQEIKTLAEFLNGAPLLVGERSSSRPLEAGVVYARHGIPILTLDTLQEFLLEGVPPLVFAAPGGFYVHVDGPRLRRIREERGLSLGQLAEVGGVSRRAISMYEEGMSAMVEVAQRLEEFLDEALVEPVDPFEPRAVRPEVAIDLSTVPDGMARELLVMMERLGFRVAPVEKGPFQGIASAGRGFERRAARDEGVVLTGVSDAAPDLPRNAAAVARICEVTETFGAFFVHKRTTTRVSIEGMPLLGLDELARLDDPQRVLDILDERRKRVRQK